MDRGRPAQDQGDAGTPKSSVTREKDDYWLDICHHLNIEPRAQDTLTIREWDQAVHAINLIREEAKKAG